MFPVKLLTLAHEGSLQEISNFLEGDFTSSWGHIALCGAAESGRLEIVKGLLDAGVNIHSEGVYDVLFSAAGSWHELSKEILHFLLERGADIDTVDGRNRTALFSAAYSQRFDNVRFLVEHGVNINHQDRFGGTALSAAVEVGNLEIVQYLCEVGAEINLADNTGTTCLLSAAANGFDSIIEILVAYEANIHFMNQRRHSALRNALQKKQIEAARLLIKLGANIDERDHTGTSTLEWAQEKGYTFIVEEILQLRSEAITIRQ